MTEPKPVVGAERLGWKSFERPVDLPDRHRELDGYRDNVGVVWVVVGNALDEVPVPLKL